MLIKSLKASNFKKYEALEIQDIPENALIGIFGDNESGKSSIGEAVSFALFGRTAKFFEESLPQLIHWDAEICEVELVFKVADESIYRVVRHLDRKGDYKAVLYQGNQNTPFKTGADRVNSEIEKLTCFDFQNFRYTFYMAQKEIDIFTQKARSDSENIIQKMMGFDRFQQACEVIAKRQEELKSRLEKCQTELLHTRSDVKKIKVDKSEQKALFGGLEEHRQEISDLEKSTKEKEENLEKDQRILEVHQNLSSTFKTLERSLRLQFHQESSSQAQLLLKSIYELLHEEHRQQSNKLQDHSKIVEETEGEQENTGRLESRLNEIAEMIESHRDNIARRISAPEPDATPVENLRLAADSQAKRISYTEKIGTTLVISSIAVSALTLYSLLSAILVSMGKSALLFSWSSSTPLWTMFILCLVVLAGSALGVLMLQKRLVNDRARHAQLISQIAVLKEEEKVCKSFDINHLTGLQEFVSQLNNSEIQQKAEEISTEFRRLVDNKIYLRKWKQELTEKHDKHSREIAQIQDRLEKIATLKVQAKEPLGDIEIVKTSQEKELEKLDDLTSIEKKIATATKSLQEHSIAAESFYPDPPPEVDSAWKDYEQQRSLLRELTGKTTIGGGTGMLNRIQMAFRLRDTQKLVSTLNQERDGFWTTLPKKEELEKLIEDTKIALKEEQQRLQKGRESLKEIESQYQKCTEELNHKKELVNKINALNSQIQSIERSIEVAKTTTTFLKATLKNANERFAPSLSRIMSRILPRITKGRYKNVKATDDLEIEAFSNEKNDFVDLSELSGGTVDQLFLTLRLAFSQAVMTARVGSASRQFLFFDEPIISFDEQRSNSFFDLLGDYSKNFVQIFLVSPRSYEDTNFDMIIRTELDTKKLIIDSSDESESPGKDEKGEGKKRKKKKPKNEKSSQKQENEEAEDSEEDDDDLRIEYTEDGEDY